MRSPLVAEIVIMSDRITDLEIQLTHQQLQVEELNGLMYRQQQEIDSLASELRQIKEQLQIVLPSLVKETEEETPPPHY
jgi:SlyX protein